MEDKNYKADILDSIALDEGQELNEEIKTVSKDKVMKEINKLSYDDNSPIPGKSIDDALDSQINSINENTALNDLIMKSATIKAANERKEQGLTAEEKAQRKKDFVEQMLYQQGEAYYEKNHYMMDGKTKRRVRKQIERNYDKGRYKKFMTGNLTLN